MNSSSLKNLLLSGVSFFGKSNVGNNYSYIDWSKVDSFYCDIDDGSILHKDTGIIDISYETKHEKASEDAGTEGGFGIDADDFKSISFSYKASSKKGYYYFSLDIYLDNWDATEVGWHATEDITPEWKTYSFTLKGDPKKVNIIFEAEVDGPYHLLIKDLQVDASNINRTKLEKYTTPSDKEK